MDDNLVGYLLGALSEHERRQVEAYLRDCPEARARLALLQQALAPLAEDDFAPPAGLADATLARLADERALPPTGGPAPAHHQLDGRGWHWARRIDWAVAAALFLLISGLAAPLLVHTWRDQRRIACANNLRVLWVGLQAYSDRGNGDFPRVEPEGPRGIGGVWVPMLGDAGVRVEDYLNCPGAGPQADSDEPVRGRGTGGAFAPCITVADLESLYRTNPCGYDAAARSLAGSYAYCLGYRDGASHRGLSRGCGDHLPILADRSRDEGGNSPNHGGAGQNVLYVGGNVRWCSTPAVGEGGDDIYLNQRFQIGAGLNRGDTVLGASDARPYRP
jgi:hypothetical protein